MKIANKLATAALLAACLPASADFVTVERAYEVPLHLYRMPATVAGSLAFKECDHCNLRVIRVTEATRYVFNNERLELADFRKELARINDRSNEFVIVLHHLESDTVTSVTVNR